MAGFITIHSDVVESEPGVMSVSEGPILAGQTMQHSIQSLIAEMRRSQRQTAELIAQGSLVTEKEVQALRAVNRQQFLTAKSAFSEMEISVSNLMDSLMTQQHLRNIEILRRLDILENHGWIDEFKRTVSRIWSSIFGTRH